MESDLIMRKEAINNTASEDSAMIIIVKDATYLGEYLKWGS